MKPKIFLILLLTFFIFHITSSIAEVRYVSLTGNNIPPYLSWEDAANSIQTCINICVDGDTIFVANGVYAETLVVNNTIWLIGSSMDSTIIDGTDLSARTIGVLQHGLGGSIENFTILGKGFNQGAVILTERNILIRNCRIKNDQYGISIINEGTYIDNIIVSNVNQGVRGGCLYDTCYNYLTNSVITLNSNSSTGISTLGGNYIINNNVILYTGTSSASSGIYIFNNERVQINNNLISGFIANISVRVVYDTGFVINNVLTNSRNSQWPPATGGILTDANRVVVKNNILTNMTLAADVDQYVNWNYNLFWNNDFNLWDTPYGDSDIVADPMFVKDTIPSSDFSFDFHFQTYSPGIDKGDLNILDKDGTRSDIGMYGGPLGETYTYQDLAPLAPRNLTALVDTNQILLRWKKNTEADTSYYNVYRDTVPDFIIDSTKLVTSITDTFFVEQIPGTSKIYVYKITCVDNQGNESEPSVERVINVTSINEYPVVIDEYYLYQNYPNPFNPSTTIGYKLKERAYVKVTVYDITGSLISVLVNREQQAGYYEVEFNRRNLINQIPTGELASGIYLYRIEVIGEGNIPVYSDMKKMLMIK